MITHQLQYGTLEVGQPQRTSSGRGWLRVDTYYRDSAAIGDRITCHAASDSDTSPTASVDQYSCECSSCWYGHSHTEDYHRQQIEQHRARLAEYANQ